METCGSAPVSYTHLDVYKRQIQIDPGTVHAIKGGLLILETQQNSDITYRVYDYDRLSNGKPPGSVAGSIPWTIWTTALTMPWR